MVFSLPVKQTHKTDLLMAKGVLATVLTVHGCFCHYLHKVARRKPSPSWHECGAADDTTQHTLEVCSRWVADKQRRTLTGTIGQDLSLKGVVVTMLDSEESCEAVVSFCEEIMPQKEAAERVREVAADAHPLRRRRTRRRRRQLLSLATRLIP
ncbi:uncharacterized protein LOC113227364 [Hyposmocoma kahamanoa]|uniref:uncharacterized protein LOC113227364 n=1 Tax=Hyposmocoma kahamanoa TaxID=1477025 RepID=UPI000E6D9DFA|nr:uncharacterized protein LOC113227364 [Hyposmocoma kahamanoa]